MDQHPAPLGTWVTVGICLWTPLQPVLEDARLTGQLTDDRQLFQGANYMSPELSKEFMTDWIRIYPFEKKDIPSRSINPILHKKREGFAMNTTTTPNEVEQALGNLVEIISRQPTVRTIGLSGGDRPAPQPRRGAISIFLSTAARSQRKSNGPGIWKRPRAVSNKRRSVS